MAGASHIYTHIFCVFTMTASSIHYIRMLYLVCLMTPYNIPDVDRFRGRGANLIRMGYQMLTAGKPHVHTNTFGMHYDTLQRTGCR